MKLNRLTTMVILAMILGVLVGYACHAWAPTPEAAKEIAGYFGLPLMATQIPPPMATSNSPT